MGIYYCFEGDHFVDDDEHPCEEINNELVCPDHASDVIVDESVLYGLCGHCGRNTTVTRRVM